MTQREFWQRARAKQWHVAGVVICENYGVCPLGAVAHIGYSPLASTAAKMLGLPVSFAQRVARAADSPKSKFRPWLLKNLGVRS
jgi:hypothetical protein